MGERGHIGENRTHLAAAKIAVVIPHYQEEPGILRGAVTSAMAQEGVSDLEIIVVDDGSPAPARDDLGDLEFPAHVTLRLIEQANRGPGAARNRGLDDVAQDTVYVAFLDSDDRWTTTHLKNAQLALNNDSDIYFSDYGYSDTLDTHFVRSLFNIDCHECIDSEAAFYCLTSNFDICAASGQCAIQTVVYRYKKVKHLRFPDSFYIGEDSSFLLGLAGFARKTVFSTSIECVSGPGVHILKNSGWGSPRAIWALGQWIKSKHWIQQNIRLSPDASKAIDHAIDGLRRDFVANLLHDIKRHKLRTYGGAISFVRHDPAVMVHFVPIALRLSLKKTKRWLHALLRLWYE